MITLSYLQRLVVEDKATIWIAILPAGFKARPGDTVMVSAGNNEYFYGPTCYGNDIEEVMMRALARAKIKPAPAIDGIPPAEVLEEVPPAPVILDDI